jgi:chromosome partitioning protein
MRETAKLADIVLVPTKLERFDLETLPTVRDTLEFTRATRRAWIVLNMLQPLAVGVQSSIEMTGRELLQRDGWQIAPTGLCRLQDYTASINDGRTAGELAPEGRAAGEMRALWAWLQEECAVHA